MPDLLEPIAAREAERAGNYERGERARLLATVDHVVAAAEGHGMDYVFIGGLASAIYGRPRVTHDVDVFVRPEDARDLLGALADRGFDVEERAPDWLFKAWRSGQDIDIIFRSSADIYLDDELLDHARTVDFEGRPLRIASPEDLVVIKAAAHAENSPRHWHDALGILAGCDLDWRYLVDRARRSPRRVLSLLIYAESNDLLVPDDVLSELFRSIVPSHDSRQARHG
jgi:predicted nucleotidyltransferase